MALNTPYPPPIVSDQFASLQAQKASILGFFTGTATKGDKGGDIYWSAVLKK